MKSKGSTRILKYVTALIAFLIIIFPVYWMVISSFKPKKDLLNPKIIPSSLTLENYVSAFRDYDILTYMKNSVVVTLLTVLLVTLIATLAAYAICFLKMRATKFVMPLTYIVQILPGIVMLLPLFTIYRFLGLQNSYTSLILTYTASTMGIPVALIMMCGYFQGISKEIFESASIDGASTFTAFWRILLPLGTSGIFCTAIYIFVITWQEFMFAANLITNPTMYTMPVGLQMFVSSLTSDWGGMMAASTVISIPAVILFVCIQNYFVDNLAGSVKE